MDKALQGRIAAGPTDAVEEDIAIAHGGDVSIGGQSFDKQAMVRGLQTQLRKHGVQTPAK